MNHHIGGRIVQCDQPLLNRRTAVYLRRPGVAKKFKAEVLAEAKVREGGPALGFVLQKSSVFFVNLAILLGSI